MYWGNMLYTFSQAETFGTVVRQPLLQAEHLSKVSEQIQYRECTIKNKPYWLLPTSRMTYMRLECQIIYIWFRYFIANYPFFYFRIFRSGNFCSCTNGGGRRRKEEVPEEEEEEEKKRKEQRKRKKKKKQREKRIRRKAEKSARKEGEIGRQRWRNSSSQTAIEKEREGQQSRPIYIFRLFLFVSTSVLVF